jgi:dTDP-4-dehydrorhamnose 3,5-epimerase
MTFEETPLKGAFVLHREGQRDERGSFERLWCAREFAEHGLAAGLAQTSLSKNPRRGTLRGLHYQRPPAEEDKIVTCIRGRIFDVIVDIRKPSPTRGRWYGVELAGARPDSIYIPKGFAHGFITLEDDSEILYQIAEFQAPELAAGILWCDADLAIDWPMRPLIISARDEAWPTWRDQANSVRADEA